MPTYDVCNLQEQALHHCCESSCTTVATAQLGLGSDSKSVAIHRRENAAYGVKAVAHLIYGSEAGALCRRD